VTHCAPDRFLVAWFFLLLVVAPARAQAPLAFQHRCAVCHQASGSGVPGIYPPLKDTIGAYTRLPQGRTFLIHLLLFGMDGAIESHGAIYEGLMPPAADLSDGDLAEILNYVLSALNGATLPGDFKPLTPIDFETARTSQLTATDVFQEREKLITLVNKGATSRSDNR
jgi:mono/diheme cytochrome c family protein